MSQQKIQTLPLERSSNTHMMTGVLEMTEKKSYTAIKVRKSKSKVFHGEHATIGIESEHCLKYVQQEFNPVTKALANAWD